MSYVLPFSAIGIHSIPEVGGKNASLGEMYSQLSSAGIKVPNGYATTAEAYHYFIKHNNLQEKISRALESLDVHDVKALAKTGKQIRSWMLHAEIPDEIAEDIIQGYLKLGEEYGEYPDVAVRSSATAEDLADASFAGQQETYLNISGRRNLLLTCKRVFASLFTDRAISYREDKGFNHMDVALSIGVQKMVRSDMASSGVMFTLDTESGFRDVVFINSSYGLGENVVQGSVNPDEFYVFKKTLVENKRPIIRRNLGQKAIKMVYAQDTTAGLSTRNVKVTTEERNQFSLTDDEVLELSRYAVLIEDHYARPMDIEWGKDGKTGELFILQARPETVQANLELKHYQRFKLNQQGDVVAVGKSVGKRIATGVARVVLDAADLHQVQAGDVLVTDITDPDWEPVMKIAAAIVTNRGGRTCHAAIVARELGIPAIVGCGDATLTITNNQLLTVSCAEGDTGYIYDGLLDFDVETNDFETLGKTQTRIMLNLANPELAFECSQLPVDGVGLARLEFIINSSIRIHPKALLEYESLDNQLQKTISEITAGYADPVGFYVDKLAEGIGTIAAAFYPRQVIVRLSDFKSNEYASLLGGDLFEPEEENPMIGFRGAFRYPSDMFHECFALECQALIKVREVMGLNNVDVMVPFVRSLEEGRKTLELMDSNGLVRGNNSLKVYLMCEIPVNVLLAEKFLQDFDGFSIGSNDLTQLTLGVDRDSGLITGFDERNEAVTIMMKMAINACKKADKYVGICGQAPSDFPEITHWLVDQGISSISLNPDSVIDMTHEVLLAESKLSKH
ncbi:MAG: phosphoenolpyruvate synthase [Gammaproteobacteria bacterium]|nr:phosphoenolpyruvate synthase [Gammaproteobacteria bacterium]MCW9004945.1 phosphoenolpyruvate synthase [Gammaproteobacteria bacterium]